MHRSNARRARLVAGCRLGGLAAAVVLGGLTLAIQGPALAAQGVDGGRGGGRCRRRGGRERRDRLGRPGRDVELHPGGPGDDVDHACPAAAGTSRASPT